MVTRGKSDVSTRLPGADANLRGSPEEVLVIAQSGMTHGLHGHLKWLSKQLITDKSDDDFLVRDAGTYGLTKTVATKASGQLTVTGSNSILVPDTTTFFTRNDGERFVVTVGGTTALGQVVVTIEAVDAGADGNCDAGTILTIVSPITGINATATVGVDGITDGTDIETTEALRTRTLERKQSPPKGGGPGDYVAWAKKVSGVTRAWEYPRLNGPGTVGLYFVRDNDIDIFPDSGAIDDVQAYLDAHAPVTAETTVYAPTPETVDFTIHIVPDNSDTRAAVTAELEALFFLASRPGDGDGAGTIEKSQVQDAIGVADGVTDYTLSIPAADVVPAIGVMPKIGTISWV